MDTTAQDTPDLVGTVLAGRYRIVQRLGEGAMGTVYLGEHLRIGRRDAVKVLRDTLSADRETIARFMRGARILSSIRHPNVCTIYDFSDTDEGLQYLAMELVVGESLKDLLDRERVLSPLRALRIALQVADALQAAHEQAVVHRDLKPANIMIVPGKSGEDAIKVVDFDIAKGPRDEEGSEVTRLGFVVGTPEYMSPEQLVGERIDGRSDLYSLGLVLFRMLSGVLPFRSSALQEMMVERLTQPPLTLMEVCPEASFPPGLQAILSRTLERRAEDRYASAADVQRDLAAVLAQSDGSPAWGAVSTPAAGLPASEVPATQIAPAAAGRSEAVTPRRTSGRVLGGVALLAVLLGGAGGGWWLHLNGFEGKKQVAHTIDPPPPPSEPVKEPAPSTDPIVADPPQQPHIDPAPTRPRESLPPDRNKEQGSSGSRGGPGTPPQTVPPRSAPQLDRAAYHELVVRQFTQLNAGTLEAGQLAAIRDSAELVYNAAGAASDDRATAAYTIANAWVKQKNLPQMRRWLHRALELRPEYPPYLRLLNTYPEDP